MSGRRPPEELILGRLFTGPADPEGAQIIASALNTLLAGHPLIGSNTPQTIGTDIAERAGLEPKEPLKFNGMP